MNRRGVKALLILLLAVFFTAVAGLAAFYHFPFGPAVREIKREIEAAGPLRLEFDAPEIGRPFSVILNRLNASLAFPEGRLPLFQAARLNLDLKPWRLAWGRIGLNLNMESAQGRLKGWLEAGIAGQREIRLDLEEIVLPAFSLADPQQRMSLSGRLEGRARVMGRAEVMPTAGQGRLAITGGRLTGLNVPGLPFSQLDFDRLEAIFKLDSRQVTLESLKIESRQAEVELKGLIQDYRRPRLALTGRASLLMNGQTLAGLDMSVTGPLTKPVIKTSAPLKPGG
ncbi:MAG: type II secretion system protein GspN [Thermodesulfobacteriota bacterium]